MSQLRQSKKEGPHPHVPNPESSQSVPSKSDASAEPQCIPSSKKNRPVSPATSNVSMKSEGSIFEPPNFSADLKSVSTVTSHVLMKSKGSIFEPPNFSNDPPCVNPEEDSPVTSHVSMKREGSIFEPPNFSGDLNPERDRSVSPVTSPVFVKSEGSIFEPPNFSGDRKPQKKHRAKSPVSSHEFSPKRFRLEAPELPRDSSDSRHQLTDQTSLTVSKAMDDDILKEVSVNNKDNLKRWLENIRECVLTPATQTPHKSIYIDLYVTEGESEGLNQEHEVLQVESASRAPGFEESSIDCKDIFNPLHGQKGPIRTVLTKGVACIGKTVFVQKFIIDWADGKANEDLDFVFFLPFRWLNRIKDSQYSLHQLLLKFHPELEKLKDNSKLKDCQILFICFALHESSFPLNFQENRMLSDVSEVATVDTLITSLIQGSLLPSAHLWITSRPVASDQIPPKYISRVTEVQGFSDTKKEEYFRQRIRDEGKVKRILAHVKSSRSLSIMCRLPVFCWIAATVLQQMLEEGTSERPPTTLTEMFVQFLLIQTTRSKQIYQARNSQESQNALESQKDVIMKLSHFAFRHLLKGNYMFSEEEVKECGLDVNDVLVRSGLCTDVLKGESLSFGKMYTFVHVTVQECLAALYVFACYINKTEEGLKHFLQSKSKISLKDMSLDELLKGAVNRALESKSGHLDLFVRFLHGISLDSNQKLLKGLLLTRTEHNPESVKKTIRNLKELKRPNISPNRWINLLHCLVEMNDSSVHKEVQSYLKSERGAVQKLKLAHCSALANVLLMAKDPLDELDLKKYKASDEGRRRLIPAVQCCKKALLSGCKLTEKCCEVVASALESAHSHLRELDLSHNNLQKSEEILFRGLQSQHCKLESLSLAKCNLTVASYKSLASVLQAAHSPLRELDLSKNPLEDSGVEHLSSGLRSPNCRLQTLRLVACGITRKGCELLASALSGNPASNLRELNISENKLGEAEVKLLSQIKKIQTLC
ncbi:NLR family CARD domain-containing protein 3-like [Alosa alosa]|uniref:NLR family CARD domain-containing protein 3-like n=1 Tax=Alosa alosa TaxID=278164 RepID=UPI00201520F2|nr:NLR family CARD domain-containing protein 3-like [Alosa alosa]